MKQHRNHRIKYIVLVKYSLLLIAILVAAGNSAAQDTEKLADEYIQNYLNNTIEPFILQQLNEKPKDQVLNAFAAYTEDTIPRIRRISYQMIYKTGLKAENADHRKKSVKLIVLGLHDSDAGIAGICVNYLCDFSPEDFDAEQRYYISMKVRQLPKPAYVHKMILLSGYLGISDLTYYFEKMLEDTASYTSRDRWSILLAMARMNDPQAIDQVIRRIKTIEPTDDVVYELYPKLTYIRKKASFDILFDAILSDEKNCLSANPDNEVPIVCAFRVLGYVAPYIENFPIKTDAYGEPVLGNYDVELAKAREWIKANRENYTLIYNKY